jgi:hypothetical protein
MNLTEARLITRNSVLHVAPGTYDDAKVDRALKFALGRFARLSRCCREVVEVDTVADERTVDIANVADMAGKPPFIVDGLIHARIGFKPLAVVDWATIARTIEANSTATAQPTTLAFETVAHEATLYPLPDDVYTIVVAYAADLVEWETGVADGDSVELNLPERFVREAIWMGAGTALVYGEAGNLWAQTGWQKFEELIKDARGQITANPGVILRTDPLDPD